MNSYPTEPGQMRTLPDAAVCRAARTGIGDLVYCAVPVTLFCTHRICFGENLFCAHPARAQIVSQTEAEQNN